jgi:hypothetical protein
MNRHLVTVKVGIEGGTGQRMQLDRVAFDKFWHEGLDPQAVKGWGAIQQDRVVANDFFEDIIHNWMLTLDHPFCAANGVDMFEFLKVVNDEWLE